MMLINLIIIGVLPWISIAIHILYATEVKPTDFMCNHQKQIKGDPRTVFEFITSSQGLEKLLPWLTRFREADKRPILPNKSYTGLMIIPIWGKRRFYAKLTDYRPGKLFALEFPDDWSRQRIVIRTRSYHDRTLLEIAVHSRRTSMLYQYTIGYAFRVYVKRQLEESIKNVAAIIEKMRAPNNIPNFSRDRL